MINVFNVIGSNTLLKGQVKQLNQKSEFKCTGL